MNKKQQIKKIITYEPLIFQIFIKMLNNKIDLVAMSYNLMIKINNNLLGDNLNKLNSCYLQSELLMPQQDFLPFKINNKNHNK